MSEAFDLLKALRAEFARYSDTGIEMHPEGVAMMLAVLDEAIVERKEMSFGAMLQAEIDREECLNPFGLSRRERVQLTLAAHRATNVVALRGPLGSGTAKTGVYGGANGGGDAA
jgi:hypothetical protein